MSSTAYELIGYSLNGIQQLWLYCAQFGLADLSDAVSEVKATAKVEF